MNKDRYVELLPQKKPMLFVDNVLELEHGKCCIAEKKLLKEEEYLKGHFPGNPIMPGCLIVESMAQSAGLMFVNEDNNEKLKEFYLVQIKKANFYKPVIPECVLKIKTEFKRNIADMIEVSAVVTVDEEKVASANLTLYVTDK